MGRIQYPYLRQIKRFRRTTGEPWRVIDPPSPTSLLAASGGGRAELLQEESRGVRVFNVRGEKTSENPWEFDWSGEKNNVCSSNLCSWFSLYFILIVSVIFPCSPGWEQIQIVIPIDLQVSFNHHPDMHFPRPWCPGSNPTPKSQTTMVGLTHRPFINPGSPWFMGT